MKEKVGIVSLGCAKNRVDSENMLGYLSNAGYKIISDPAEADIIVINTCGFIGPAKEESIDTILEMARYKTDGTCKMLLVTGCLSERYQDELSREMPEVDGFLGVGNYQEIDNVINEIRSGISVTRYTNTDKEFDAENRILTTPGHSAYLKIAEGCNNRCSYCAIPAIRGPYRSRKMEDILREAVSLSARGVKELILIAQDTTRYGEDLYGEGRLAQLLKEICNIEKIEWVRVLYTYPEKINDQLLDIIENEPKICKYLDIPIQHIDDRILKRMGRLSSSRSIKALLKNIRDRKTDFVLRTSLIVGFPGEDEEAFSHLKGFIQEYPFDRIGVFPYSQEEGTPAARMDLQLPEKIKKQRYHSLMQVQREVSRKLSERRIGTIMPILIEGKDANRGLYYGRSYGEAPEIDGKIFVSSECDLATGKFVNVRITKAYEYDLLGEISDESC